MSAVSFNAISVWLKKWGLIEVEPAAGGYGLRHSDSKESLYCEYAGERAAGVSQGRVVSPHESKSLRLRFRSRETLVWPGSDLGPTGELDLAWPVDTLRRIPASREESSSPYRINDRLYGGGHPISWAQLDPGSDGEVLGEAADPELGRYVPTIVRGPEGLVAGLPLLELISVSMGMPHCADGYYAPEQRGPTWRLEKVLFELIDAEVARRGVTVVRPKHWPEGYEAALTIRHDYDRPISESQFDRLLQFYRDRGLKCSVGFMTRLMPSSQMRRLAENGHEIVLHTEAATSDDIAAELTRMRDEAGVVPVGVTHHGGIGSAGHLGATAFRRAQANGLQYTEQLGRQPGFPHPALSVRPDGIEQISGVMLTSEHHSLDIGTAPHAQTAKALAEDIYIRLGEGVSVTIMNHPDIHLDDLMRLLDRIVLEDVWKTTHAELCEWCRITKYEAQWQIGTERAHVRFPAPLPAPLPVEIVHEGTRRQMTVPAGEREWSIALSPATAAPSTRQEEETPSPRRLSAERRAAAFRRRPPARAHQHDCEETEMKAQQPARAALIVRADADREAALSRLRAHRAGFRYPPADIRVFSLSGGSVTWPVNEQESASLLHHALQGLFDLVVVDQTVRLFDGAFAQTLMACWIDGIRPGGRLYLPLDGRGRVTNGLVRDRAQELLNAELVDHKPGSGCYLDAPAVLEKPASVFSWYATNANRLVLEETLFLNSGGALANDLGDPLIAEFMELGENPATASGARSGTAAEVPDWAREIDNIVSSHAYLVNGLAYKAPVLSWIVEQLLPGRQDLEYVDIGGGFGGLAAELHLMAPGRFAQVLTRELATQNIILARSLYAGLHDRLEGVFRYSPGRAETFAYSRGYDVISFIGSLLYVDKQQLDDVLARVWEGVRPGGLLVVHENIRHPNFTRDYDVMFDSETLNAKLGQFGTVRCFLSTALKEVTPAQAESKTVFRVVQKSA